MKPVEDYQKVGHSITLDEALTPLRSAITNLDEYVRKAKTRTRASTSSVLNEDQSAALYLYTMQIDDNSFSRLLNRALRSENNNELKKYWLNYLQLLLSAFNKLFTAKGYVYQGTSTNIKEKYPKGKIITWHGITSCTRMPDKIVNAMWGENLTLLNLKVHNGKDISAYSCSNNETEIVLLPGTRLRVMDVKKNIDLNIDQIDLEEVNDKILQIDAIRNLSTQRVSNDASLGKRSTFDIVW